ncbi:MAG: LOG family protein [Armatimonadetes bacterium]|nr:LOG family protein [Armatimonadota bacterium]
MSEMKVKVGVVGSAGGRMDEEVAARAFEVGRQAALRGCVLLTGACPGYPHQAVLGAKSVGGLVIGISPALCWQEHVERYHSPWREYDAIIYTGSGLMGREVELIRSSDIVVVIAGRSGTLGEFAIAYDEAKLVAVLERTGGIADHVPEIVRVINKKTGAEIVSDPDPEKLLDQALAVHERRVAEGVAYIIPVHT